MANMDNELGVSMEEMANAAPTAEVIKQDNIAETLTQSEPTPELEETIEVEDSSFWNEGADQEQRLDSEPQDIDGEEVSSDSDIPLNSEGIISYKANGKEVSVDISTEEGRADLAKKLALLDGARKAFSDKNKLRQQVKALEERANQGNQYKESWDKLEALKDNPERLYEVITGQSFSDMMAKEYEKRSIYNNATEEERKIMDYEDRIRRMELQSEREQKRREDEIAKAEERNYTASKKETQTKLEREFFKYEFDNDSPATANKLKKILWRSALGDLQDYQREGYKMSDKLIQKAFNDNAKALQSFYGKEVAKGVKKVTEKKKADAKEKAQAASTRNYKKPDFGDLASKDPLSIFNAFRKNK
jgi:hypothetical protein